MRSRARIRRALQPMLQALDLRIAPTDFAPPIGLADSVVIAGPTSVQVPEQPPGADLLSPTIPTSTG